MCEMYSTKSDLLFLVFSSWMGWRVLKYLKLQRIAGLCDLYKVFVTTCLCCEELSSGRFWQRWMIFQATRMSSSLEPQPDLISLIQLSWGKYLILMILRPPPIFCMKTSHCHSWLGFSMKGSCIILLYANMLSNQKDRKGYRGIGYCFNPHRF